ncbi:hypothetical protein BMY_0028 [Wohlfahrtiimonas chitiniclastica]|nr:hypothetical protein BMY_0028 [Wohlfahrtiimonas chitiniclastica]
MYSEDEKAKRLVSSIDFIEANFRFQHEVWKHVEIPEQLKKAICEVAVSDELIIARSRTQNSIKIDVIQVEYKIDSSAYQIEFDRIKIMLKGLLMSEQRLFMRVSR